jgi:enamine deaminase RidA (YjgF/YER057c/UK114 family)
MDGGFAPQVSRVLRIPRHGFDELFLTAPGSAPTNLDEALAELQDFEGGEVAVVNIDVFGHDQPLNGNGASRQCALQEKWPVTWVKGGDDTGHHLGGLHLHGISGVPTRAVSIDGRVVGTVAETPFATEVMLGGVRAASPADPRPQQARETFEKMEAALALVGMDFSNVVRTWLFLDDILAWYNDFNKVRTGFFHERRVFDGMVPASTGIGGSNPAGTAMITGVYAIKPKTPEVRAFAIPSPLQCPALEYGSSFSRAVEVDMPDHRRVFISGTASISPDGKTQHVGNTDLQVARTCEVVYAILESRGMDWEDVTRATAYVRHPEDFGALARHCAAAGIPALPVVIANNTICRDDLLFEIEVDAVKVA